VIVGRTRTACSAFRLLRAVVAASASVCPSPPSSSLSTMSMAPIVIPASGKHTATVIFFHGLGDTGHGWAPVFQDMIREPHIKYICPHAPTRAVTLNMGMKMPAWFDMFGLTVQAKEDDKGIEESAVKVRAMLDEEIKNGIPSNRIVVGGFSMGGALALYSAFTYDQPLAGIVALSSFLVQRYKVPGNHTANKEVPVFQAHGDADPLCDLAFGQATATLIQIFDPNHEMKIYKGMGHSACDQEFKDVKAFLAKRLPPI